MTIFFSTKIQVKQILRACIYKHGQKQKQCKKYLSQNKGTKIKSKIKSIRSKMNKHIYNKSNLKDKIEINLNIDTNKIK